ncbi:MAG: FAD-dependent oxidoreductase [Spirochaetaceae bacterium]|jgi:formate dehydrogenase major subunit|nr:FAD-dependent oxidoreductase [Spirochaetaceae bacterium]
MATLNITINDKPLQVEAGTTILNAATAAGFEIPTFCHSWNLKPYTSCFICAVKVEPGRGNLVPACATKVAEGQKITVSGPEVDASRRMCLNLLVSDHCGDCLPPCQTTCPSSIDIKGFLALVREGKEEEAAKLIREKAPFPGVLGRICPRPCEEECRRNRVEGPVAICNMKRHIADTELAAKRKPQLPAPAPSTGKKVAVVGAGPAGMTAAYFLRLQGHAVSVFEKHKVSGGMLRYGIPYYRLPDETLKTEFGAIEALGVEVKYGVEIGKDIPAKKLEADYDALILAVGAQGASPIGVPGEDLPGVWSGIQYLGESGEGATPKLGSDVYVVGGGNTAMDCVRSAVRGGSRATCLYRRGREEMPANDMEIEEAEHEGVKFEYLTAPVKIEKDGDKLKLTLIKMELGEPDASGRRSPKPKAGTEYTVSATAVVGAIGQRVLPQLAGELGLDLVRNGAIAANPQTFQTSRQGIFACGDCQTGANIAVRAVGNGRKTAVAVDQFLKGEEVKGEEVLFNSQMGPLDTVSEELFKDAKKQDRIKMPVISDGERKTTEKEVETGFNPQDAKKEAERCLECGCEAIKDCRLREYATKYGADQNYFGRPSEEDSRRAYQIDCSHPKIKMQSNKCINCAACVRVCAEVKGLSVLGLVNRGFATRMLAPFGRSLVGTKCDGCGECVKVCPTAGVMEKKAG